VQAAKGVGRTIAAIIVVEVGKSPVPDRDADRHVTRQS
jgi:hypothetical protein